MGKKKIILPKVVIDTNVIVSALLFKGDSNKIIALYQERKIIFLISKDILQEYIKVLSYPKFNLNQEEIKYLIKEEILSFTNPVKVTTNLNIIKDDPDDNKFLECAVAGKADFIISGDNHLLNIEEYEKIKILKTASFLLLLSPLSET